MTLNILDDSHYQIWVRSSDSTITVTQERVGLRDFRYHPQLNQRFKIRQIMSLVYMDTFENFEEIPIMYVEFKLLKSDWPKSFLQCQHSQVSAVWFKLR